MKRRENMIIDSNDVKKSTFEEPDREKLEEYFNLLGSKGLEIVNTDLHGLEFRGGFSVVPMRDLVRR